MIVRRLNDDGLQKMREFLASLRTDSPEPYPLGLLTSDEAGGLSIDIDIEPLKFSTRYDLAKYMHDRFEAAKLSQSELDRGVWSWLALFFFDQLYPKEKRVKKNPGNDARWIPVTTDFRKYYRHLVAGPYGVYHAHRADPTMAAAVLCAPPDAPGDVYEQLASRQELITNSTVLEMITILYFDSARKKLKKGSTDGPGSVRRLIAFLKQLDVTWDLYQMTSERTVQMLPEEFANFRVGSSR
jgi:hypothetical protein